MLRYLKEAFWIRLPVPGLGYVPVNAVASACLALLGLANPGFWLLGLGLETAFLWGLSTHPRFRKYVDARLRGAASGNAEAGQQVLISRMDEPSRQRMLAYSARSDRVLDTYRRRAADPAILQDTTEALQRLRWSYLRLHISRQYLSSQQSQVDERMLRKQIEEIDQDLARADLSKTVKNSKAATYGILLRRLENVGRREKSLKEIDSDLARIEAQIDLTLENAELEDAPRGISMNIELAGHLLDSQVFGDSGPTVAALDESFGLAGTPRQTEEG